MASKKEKIDSEKIFYNIIALSAQFAEFDTQTRDALYEITTANGTNVQVANAYSLLWQARAQMAIAQQLTMIAKHLGKIVDYSEATK